MKAINIIWDVDNKRDLKHLPTEIEIPEEIEDEEEISDYLSDVTGFCHKGFELIDCVETDAVKEENECKGCIYDLTDRVETDVAKFNTILDNCCSCKRGKLKEFQDGYPDLYKTN